MCEQLDYPVNLLREMILRGSSYHELLAISDLFQPGHSDEPTFSWRDQHSASNNAALNRKLSTYMETQLNSKTTPRTFTYSPCVFKIVAFRVKIGLCL